jgi:hypothetical protein
MWIEKSFSVAYPSVARDGTIVSILFITYIYMLLPLAVLRVDQKGRGNPEKNPRHSLIIRNVSLSARLENDQRIVLASYLPSGIIDSSLPATNASRGSIRCRKLQLVSKSHAICLSLAKRKYRDWGLRCPSCIYIVGKANDKPPLVHEKIKPLKRVSNVDNRRDRLCLFCKNMTRCMTSCS